jgi:NhaP-type Na+/H+ and K+/H+ antiporter
LSFILRTSKEEFMLISWDGLASVVRGVSSVIFAEILLAYLMHGYSDMATIYIIIFISSLLMLLGSCVNKNKGVKHAANME